jgi:hypothetical protein
MFDIQRIVKELSWTEERPVLPAWFFGTTHSARSITRRDLAAAFRGL